MIEAIRHAPTLDSAGVLHGMRAMLALEGASGIYIYHEHGDTSLAIISGDEVKNETFEYVQTLTVPQNQ